MKTEVHLSCKGVELAPEEESLVRAEVEKLERFFDRLVACRVVVSAPHRYAGGQPVAWTIRLALTVPGGELAVNRQAKPSFRHALQDTFDAARRQLQDHAHELRGDVKLPTGAPMGVVTRLFGYEGYGIISADDGREIYFHRNSVPDGEFDHLAVGVKVRYVESEGKQGPQASTVVSLGRPAPAASSPG